MPTKANKQRTKNLLRKGQQYRPRPIRITAEMERRGLLPVWYGGKIVLLSEPKEK